jgi:hypothetical protein
MSTRPASHRVIWATDVVPARTARSVHVEKNVSKYFFLGEVRIHGKVAP